MTGHDVDDLLALARQAEFTGPAAGEWIDRLAPRRAALLQSVRKLAGSGQLEAAVELASRTYRLFLMLDDAGTGRAMLAAALDTPAPAPTAARALALYGDGMLAFRQGDQHASRARNEEALDTARQAGDRGAEALALVGLSRVALRDGDYSQVQTLAREALDLARTIDDSAQAAPLHLLAAGTRLGGDFEAAAALYLESLALSRKLGDLRGVAMELHNLGHVQLHRGRPQDAERLFKECDPMRNRDDPYEVAMSLLDEAALAFHRGDRTAAEDLLGQTTSTLDAAGIVLDPDDRFELAWLKSRLSTQSATPD